MKCGWHTAGASALRDQEDGYKSPFIGVGTEFSACCNARRPNFVNCWVENASIVVAC